MTTAEIIIQIVIAVTGVVAIWLAQDANPKLQKWACVFGLVGQPFWLYSTAVSGQMGMFVLAAFYTLAWIKGVRVHWFTPKPAQCGSIAPDRI